MRVARAALAMLPIAPLTAAGPSLDTAAVRRGALAVGDRTSEQPALRAATDPSLAFRLGASLHAWRNGAAAVHFDSTHTTGDGGDDVVLAADCRDERLAFAALESARAAAGASEAESVAAAGEEGQTLAADWLARRSSAPVACG